jgi:hypothetical protein
MKYNKRETKISCSILCGNRDWKREFRRSRHRWGKISKRIVGKYKDVCEGDSCTSGRGPLTLSMKMVIRLLFPKMAVNFREYR